LKNFPSKSRLRRVPPFPPIDLTVGFRGKILGVEVSIPRNWYKAGDSIPIKVILTPDGYKKVGWIKATLVQRVTVKTKGGEGTEVVYEYGLADERIEDDTEFDPEQPSVTKTLNLSIPVHPPLSPHL
jgi:Arrestin (or S-antigen), C-terminal domain